MTVMDLSTLWTTTQAANHCKISPKTWRAYVATREGMPKPVARHPATGEALYVADEVRDWNKARPGRGARTDAIKRHLRPLAERIVAEAPLPRAIRVDRHDLDDGVIVLVSWHRMEQFGGPQADTVEQERLDSIWAISPTRALDTDVEPERVWTAHEVHWVYGQNFRDVDVTLDALVRVVRAARRDHAEDLAVADHRQAVRDYALARLRESRDRVQTAYDTPGRNDYLDALAHRRSTVHRYREGPSGLTLAEIADAAGITVDDVERAY
jgi:hypothetical protein